MLVDAESNTTDVRCNHPVILNLISQSLVEPHYVHMQCPLPPQSTLGGCPQVRDRVCSNMLGGFPWQSVRGNCRIPFFPIRKRMITRSDAAAR
jgi:hypothetical protein